jgi:hypothetical protein
MKHPEKWYIPVTKENRAELQTWWRKQALKSEWTSNPNFVLRRNVIVLSQHPTDDSYYYAGTESGFKENYPSYEKITLEQFRQITNPHPEHWCIEATEENFKELYAWWRKEVPYRYREFRVGETLMSDHPEDSSKYHIGNVKKCLEQFPHLVEITLEQFRQITNPNQTKTTMTKQIQISRELLNEYYEAATTPQKEYLTEHFKLDGRTTDEAIRGLHDMACSTWKPKIKKNHPDCFPEDSKYFDFSEFANRGDDRVVSVDVCKSLGLNDSCYGFIQVRVNSGNPETHHRSFYLSEHYNWELKRDREAMVLIPTKKLS